LIERLNIGFAGVTTDILMGVMMVGGLGLTFGILFLLRNQYQTGWAAYPAAVLLSIAVMILFFSNLGSMIGPIALIVAGMILVIYTMFRKNR
jgi:NhaP-type Na+/H+ or K+/H+ antiporter